MKKVLIIVLLFTTLWGGVHSQTTIPLTFNQHANVLMPDRDLFWSLNHQAKYVNFENHPTRSGAIFLAPLSANWFLNSQLGRATWAADDLFHFEFMPIYSIPIKNSSLNFAIGIGGEHNQFNARRGAVNLSDPLLQYQVKNHLYSVAGISFVQKFFVISVKNTKGINFSFDGELSYLGSFDVFAGGIFRMADDNLILMPTVETDFSSLTGGLGISYNNQSLVLKASTMKTFSAQIDIWVSSYLQVGFGYQHSGTMREAGWLAATISGRIKPQKIKY